MYRFGGKWTELWLSVSEGKLSQGRENALTFGFAARRANKPKQAVAMLDLSLSLCDRAPFGVLKNVCYREGKSNKNQRDENK